MIMNQVTGSLWMMEHGTGDDRIDEYKRLYDVYRIESLN